MQLPPLSPNIIISAALVVGGLYGIIAGKQRLRILILSIYVGIVLAEQMSEVVSTVLKMISHEQVSWLLLGLPIIIFGVAGVRHGSHDKGSGLANIIVGILAAALIVSSTLRLLPTSALTATDNDSFIAMILQQNHLWILGLLPLVALVLGLLKKKEKH
jgi:hypothetical protein